VFEGDFWGKSVAEFSHSLGHKQPVNFLTIERQQGIKTSCSGFEKGELADRADSPIDSSV